MVWRRGITCDYGVTIGTNKRNSLIVNSLECRHRVYYATLSGRWHVMASMVATWRALRAAVLAWCGVEGGGQARHPVPSPYRFPLHNGFSHNFFDSPFDVKEYR